MDAEDRIHTAGPVNISGAGLRIGTISTSSAVGDSTSLPLFYHSRQRKIRNQAQGREERGQDQQD